MRTRREWKGRECGIDDLSFAFSAVLRFVRGVGSYTIEEGKMGGGRWTPFEMHESWVCEGDCVAGEVWRVGMCR